MAQLDFADAGVLELEWDFKDGGMDDPDWCYCIENATFVHKEACEFILHIYEDDACFRDAIEGMREYGCSPKLIAALEAARKKGARRLLIWA